MENKMPKPNAKTLAPPPSGTYSRVSNRREDADACVNSSTFAPVPRLRARLIPRKSGRWDLLVSR